MKIARSRSVARTGPRQPPILLPLVLSGITVLSCACGPSPERDDLSLQEASAAVERAVKDAAGELGRIAEDVGGGTGSCSDTLDERAGVRQTYSVGVTPRNTVTASADVLALATEWERQGWERSADGLTIELTRDFYEIEIEPTDTPDRFVVRGSSPCVPDPNA